MNRQNLGFMTNMPPVTKNLIIINVLMWLATIILPKIGIDFVDLLGLHFFKSSHFYPHQLITYIFMHDPVSFYHVFFNMFAVFMFGRILEGYWGGKRFLIFFMITGIGAGLIQELVWFWDLRDVVMGNVEMINLNGTHLMPVDDYLNLFVTIGASGAVFGILLAFGMLFPNVPLYIMFLPIPIKAKYFVFLYGFAELFMGVSNFSGDSVAHFAHLGGMLFGFIMIKYWQYKDRSNGKYF